MDDPESSPDSGASGQPSCGAGQAALDAVRRVLAPLVRFLIVRSIPFSVATEILRTLYVEIAEDDFCVPGRKQTDSRVHLLTGVHRKDVRRLREARHAPALAPRKTSLASTLIARWTTLDEYRDENGRPQPLARTAEHGASFDSLVRSVSTDIRPRVVLDEWKRLGIARVDENDRVHLSVEAFVPPKESEEILHFFGRNAHDHIAAAVRNVLGEGDRFFERAAAYDQLTPDSIDELRGLAVEKGMDALRDVNRRAMKLQRRDGAKPQATHRMSFGAYFFAENEAPRAQPDAPAPRTQVKKP